MIVQRRGPGLRLIEQHDHGLIAGEMAFAWREAEGSPEVSEILVTATALHDLGWRRLDRVPRWSAETRGAVDFAEYRPGPKFRAAARGVEEVEELDPYAAMLVSMHYASFVGAPRWFVEEQTARQEQLADEVDDDLPDPDAVETDLRLLRLFDVLSLYLCITPPGASPEGRPAWLGDQFEVPGWEDLLTARWISDTALALDPWPFGEEPVALEVPHRDLERSTFDDEDDLARAWRAAPRMDGSVVLSSL